MFNPSLSDIHAEDAIGPLLPHEIKDAVARVTQLGPIKVVAVIAGADFSGFIGSFIREEQCF